MQILRQAKKNQLKFLCFGHKMAIKFIIMHIRADRQAEKARAKTVAGHLDKPL